MQSAYPSLGRTLLDTKGQIVAGMTLYVNGREVSMPDGLKAMMADGDRILVLPVITGGE
jgi:molybdopterin converting factor small subunit